MIKGLTLILLVFLVFSQNQAEGVDIQINEESKPLTPLRGGPIVGGLTRPLSGDVKKGTGEQLTEDEKLVKEFEERAREDFRKQYNEELLTMEWTRQVVQGTNYYLSFKRSNGDKVNYYFFIPLPVYQVQGVDYMDYKDRTIIPKGK